jgi:hypothetical protein
MSRKLLVLAFGGMLIAAPLAVTPGSLSAEERGEVKIAATALGVPGAPAYRVPGALAYGGAQGPAALGVPGAPAYGVQGAPAYGVQGAPAYGVQGAPAYGVQGAPAYGVQGAPAYGVQGAPAYGVQGAPAYGVQGAPAYGMVVWIPAVVGGATAPGAATSGGTGAPQPVLCMVEPTNSAVIAEANVPAGQKVAVIANTETACRAINGTVANQAAGGARAVN